MTTTPGCPICNTTMDPRPSTRPGTVVRMVCPNCGQYDLSGTFESDFLANHKFDPVQRATLSYAIQRMQRKEGPLPLIVEDFVESILQNTKLPTAMEQLDNLVLYLGRTLSEPGETLNLNTGTMRAKLGSKTSDGSGWVIKQAIDQELMQGTMSPGLAKGDKPVVGATLSIRGWQRFAELQSAASQSKRAFMAMKFSDPELDRVFSDYFKPAAKRAGYDLVKLDDEPRAGLIDDHMRLEIRTSRFVIADLSHANQGAYWEAGYAEGLGRPVIYTCKKSILDSQDPQEQPHFDTNHYLIVPWEADKLQEAADKLTTTIRITLPSEARLMDE